ncbi:hypothetical protein DPM33_19375 [Mesorhizobium hawassense]|uniref:Uncharacterized protein n=1 Tax=Mesorhizobium hawassense TaxID=1209954 RepID=A0A330HL52_9HYPH|nr:hypothetical protein [Mesorhizobium hawassense]RAZ89125.1 hypothetical protein DPM33_19375 [Mesorhizobium hawassense]
MKPFLEGHEDPLTVLVAREMDAVSDVDVVAWAGCHAAPPSYAEDSDYQELLRSNPRNPLALGKAHGHLTSLVARVFADFDPSSAQAGEMARRLFLRRIRSYLHSDLEPLQICRMIPPIEERYDYPYWLGNLYDVCDWMDARTTRDQALHLRDAIEQILSDNGESQLPDATE